MTEAEQYDYDSLRRLAVGCKVHKAYRGLRRPRAGCDTCADLFVVAQNLVRLGVLQGERRIRVEDPIEEDGNEMSREVFNDILAELAMNGVPS